MITKWFPVQKFLEWVEGQKHPSTPRDIFMNVFNYDRVRKILKARCQICGYVVTEDKIAVKEVLFNCKNSECECNKVMGSKVHQACDLCYWMYRALYMNIGLNNLNYFKKIDEAEKARSDEDSARKRRIT